MTPRPVCQHYPGRRFVKHCTCASCTACRAENKLNKQLRDKQVSEWRAMMARHSHTPQQ
jgi:hypothetical protein